MCHPAAWFAASAATQFVASWQGAKAQQATVDYQNEIARTTAGHKMLGIRTSQGQQRAAIAGDVRKVVEAALRARSSARAGAGAAGVAGDSVDAVISEFGRQEADRLGTLAKQGTYVDIASENQVQGARLGALSSLRHDVPMPSALNFALQGFLSYQQFKFSRTPAAPPPSAGLTPKSPPPASSIGFKFNR